MKSDQTWSNLNKHTVEIWSNQKPASMSVCFIPSNIMNTYETSYIYQIKWNQIKHDQIWSNLTSKSDQTRSQPARAVSRSQVRFPNSHGSTSGLWNLTTRSLVAAKNVNRQFLDDQDRKVMIMKIMVFMKNFNEVVIIMNDNDDNDQRAGCFFWFSTVEGNNLNDGRLLNFIFIGKTVFKARAVSSVPEKWMEWKNTRYFYIFHLATIWNIVWWIWNFDTNEYPNIFV